MPPSSHDAVAQLMQSYHTKMHQVLDAYDQAPHHLWFAMSIRDHQLLSLLHYATLEMLPASLHALLYAYAHPGTREAIAQLCLGLFGEDALVIIVEEPAIVRLEITIRNENFFFALAEEETTLAEFWALADFNLESLTQNPRHFLQHFMPIGVLLAEVSITLQESAETLRQFVHPTFSKESSYAQSSR
ncbi:hypothetical protein PVA44_06765 (plasmid) [Entomospira nematocerorum]|uniref:Uncharacterized protein n=1 Tax=Entomospira nematocerorum TaxID=2719987 RepID=A0A968GEJ3_9SPIO|nr:hypothetical protein [Entomospira nematocera]NIZ47607.1 hypothetical protein [Entomospira nematocera]WDI34611.1 hypothetical protein PVA44_06765 [Entomospira nematocera]